ncbi:beta-lactamase domain-containing protein 2-like isoform X1 [Ptychodera flava]|uniref:beta-lactamase domain-containing protein 2-like isoform X1 n=2 Tax=Ptychodera flava TaxID=63121 RepID=UPI00396A6D6B
MLAYVFLAVLVAAVFATFMYFVKQQRRVRIDGKAESAFQEVVRVFSEQHEQGVEVGSAFAVYYKGKKVVDMWGGYASIIPEEPWQQDTMSTFFSATKGVAALCIAVAVDRGYLDYDQKVAHYWPDFAQNGKEDITLRQILNHQAGVPMTQTAMDLEMLKDHDAVGEVVAASELLWKPGTAHGYHSLNYGFILSQVLQRADPEHRTMGVFFHEEIAKPFGIEFYMGLPKEEIPRVASLVPPKPLYSMLRMLFSSRYRNFMRAMFNKESIPSKVFRNNGKITTFPKMATTEFRCSEVPSVNGIGTARGLARLYAILANGGELDGKRLLSQEAVETIMTSCTEEKLDTVMMTKTKWCLGFHPHFNVISEVNLENVYGHKGMVDKVDFLTIRRHYHLHMSPTSCHRTQWVMTHVTLTL